MSKDAALVPNHQMLTIPYDTMMCVMFWLQDAGSTSPFAGIKDSLDKLLIADFFLVLVALAWLGVAVAISSITGDKETPLLTIWYALWPTLWQSALGLLMAGALVSGGLGKLAEQQGKGQQ
jgi:hypothetical protein